MKFFAVKDNEVNQTSPSPRRAWIEMPDLSRKRTGQKVALPTEGVD